MQRPRHYLHNLPHGPPTEIYTSELASLPSSVKLHDTTYPPRDNRTLALYHGPPLIGAPRILRNSSCLLASSNVRLGYTEYGYMR